MCLEDPGVRQQSKPAAENWNEDLAKVYMYTTANLMRCPVILVNGVASLEWQVVKMEANLWHLLFRDNNSHT